MTAKVGRLLWASWALANFRYQPGVSTLGVEVQQAGAVAFLAGEAVVGDTDAAIAGTAIGKVPFIRDDGIALIGGQHGAA